MQEIVRAPQLSRRALMVRALASLFIPVPHTKADGMEVCPTDAALLQKLLPESESNPRVTDRLRGEIRLYIQEVTAPQRRTCSQIEHLREIRHVKAFLHYMGVSASV